MCSDMCSRGVLNTVDSDDLLPRIRTPDPFVDYEGMRRGVMGRNMLKYVEMWVVKVQVIRMGRVAVEFCGEIM